MNIVTHFAAKVLMLMAWWVVVGAILLATFQKDKQDEPKNEEEA